MAEDALVVTRMNLGPAKKQAKLCDGWYIIRKEKNVFKKWFLVMMQILN